MNVHLIINQMKIRKEKYNYLKLALSNIINNLTLLFLGISVKGICGKWE